MNQKATSPETSRPLHREIVFKQSTSEENATSLEMAFKLTVHFREEPNGIRPCD